MDFDWVLSVLFQIFKATYRISKVTVGQLRAHKERSESRNIS
jgi:hypothetical protein